MKYLFNVKMVMVSLFSLLFLKQTNVLAQTPNTGIFFQAIARDQYANPAKDRKIYVQSSIVQATATGTKVLIEEHQTTTDGSGVFSISVGQGTRTGGTVANLDKVEWAKGPYYLNLKIAITPMAPVANWDYTKDLIDLGTSPFGTVPYALYAGSSGALDSKLNIVDTVKMLSIYAKAVNVNDIANQVKTKLSVQDTTTMLAPYARMVNELIASNITSLTAETINQALDAKVNLADSLTKYVTPTQLNTKTFDSSAIYNQLALREKLSNKSINVLNDATSNDKFPSVKAIKDYVDTEIAGVTIQDGSITDAKIIGLSGSKITGNIAGNAGTATKIATPVTINGVSFDGSSNITIASAAANTLTMNASGTGDASGSTFDGSAAKTISYNTIGASPLAGSSSLTTVGTIETGVWSGTAIDVTKGGTGLTKITNGQLLFGNGTNTIGNSSNLFWNNTTNSFGIGTNTPGSGFGTILDVNGSASFRTNGANSGLKFDGYSPYGTLNVARIYTEATSGTASDFILGTYSRNSDQLYLKESNGFVGIRNSNPTTALDVNGTVTATEFAGPLIGNVTGNSTTAITAGNITATSNITLTSLSNLTTVGTITSGVWSGTAIDYTKLNIAGAVKIVMLLKGQESLTRN